MIQSTPTPDSGQSADGLHEVLTSPVNGHDDIPHGGDTPPNYRTATAIRTAAEHLATAAKEIRYARRHGASTADLIEAFGMTEGFFAELDAGMIRRMLGHLNGELALRADRIQEAHQEQNEICDLIQRIVHGDDDAVRQAVREGY